MLAERVSGDVLNAAGFPLNRVCRELAGLLPDLEQEVTFPRTGSEIMTREGSDVVGQEVTFTGTGSGIITDRK